LFFFCLKIFFEDIQSFYWNYICHGPIGSCQRSDVEINKKQESDGSWVICANQQTILKRTSYYKQQTLTCELTVDNRHHSTISSLIIIKGDCHIG
jgi:hypothetical protein